MELVLPSMIPKIDEFAEKSLAISTLTLMGRSGEAVARAVRELSPSGGRVVIFAGKGNNGGDGYAAAAKLCRDRGVTVYDVFSAGQRSEAGKYWYDTARGEGVEIKELNSITAAAEDILGAAVLVDAIFGTGFCGEYPEITVRLSEAMNSSPAKRVAVDVPLGVRADTGEVAPFALRADVTVSLSYPKAGLLSQPARDFAGKIINDTLGIDSEAVRREFGFCHYLIDEEEARALLPQRPENSSKGSFGKVLLIVGSDKYRGAAHLALEAALRGGAGYVTYVGTEALCSELRMKFPEALYRLENLSDPLSVSSICALSATQSATLIGSGCDCTRELFNLTEALIRTEGAPLILDADAINAIAKFGRVDLLKEAKRPLILTPHPLEFSRLSGLELSFVNAHRMEVAEGFSKEYGCILLLKGSATVITDGSLTYLNGSGSSALAKAGSGDVLAGLAAALCAQASDSVIASTALAAYVHGRAGDNLSAELSAYGVTPSDLPRECARVLSALSK